MLRPLTLAERTHVTWMRRALDLPSDAAELQIQRQDDQREWDGAFNPEVDMRFQPSAPASTCSRSAIYLIRDGEVWGSVFFTIEQQETMHSRAMLNVRRGRIDDSYWAPLAEVVERFLAHQMHLGGASYPRAFAFGTGRNMQFDHAGTMITFTMFEKRRRIPIETCRSVPIRAFGHGELATLHRANGTRVGVSGWCEIPCAVLAPYSVECFIDDGRGPFKLAAAEDVRGLLRCDEAPRDVSRPADPHLDVTERAGDGGSQSCPIAPASSSPRSSRPPSPRWAPGAW